MKYNEHVKLLLIYHSPVSALATIEDSVNMLVAASSYNIIKLNVNNDNPTGRLMIPKKVQLSDYHGVIIHPSVSYLAANFANLDHALAIKLRHYRGVKVLMKQDEHLDSFYFAKLMAENNFDLLLTCLPNSEISKVYPYELIGNIDYLQTLTGYISPLLLSQPRIPLSERNIDIGYRGSFQPLSIGQLGFEKRKIGYDVVKKAKEYNLTYDISSLPKDRFFGNDWFTFLLSCKAVLGVESGSNLFDYDGSVSKIFDKYIRHSGLSEDSEQLYYNASADNLFIDEGNVNYAQISPRHFEAAATRTLQILYEGSYSNIFIPYKHYLPLKRDLSNFNDIVKAMRDVNACQSIVEQAYEDIVLSDKYHYDMLIEAFDKKVAEQLNKKLNITVSLTHQPNNKLDESSNPNVNKTVSMTDNILNAKELVNEKLNIPVSMKRDNDTRKKRVLILIAHEVHLDPRISWLSDGFNNDYEVTQIGVSFQSPEANKPYKVICDTLSLTKIEINHLYKFNHVNQYEALLHLWNRLPKNIKEQYEILLQLSNKYFNASKPLFPEETEQCLLAIHVLHMTDCFVTLLHRFNEFDFIISCDGNALLAGAMLSQFFNIPLVYDAHEFWAEQFTKINTKAKDTWILFEKTLVQYANMAMTVSTQLAEVCTEVFSKKYESVPNAESYLAFQKMQDMPKPKKFAGESYCTFLFQGGFALGRGLEDLIDLWPETPENCLLYLRGVHNNYSSELVTRAKKTGLFEKRIFFPTPVSEEELIIRATQADVGIIPYDPYSSLNNKYCCPNKTSQYLAAGLPILSNDLIFVKGVIENAKAGITVDFKNKKAFLDAIKYFQENPSQRAIMGNNAKEYFIKIFHWEALSKNLYYQLAQLNMNTSIKKSDLVSYINKLNAVFEEKSNMDSFYSPTRYRFNSKILFLGKRIVFDFLLASLSLERREQYIDKLKFYLKKKQAL